MKNLEIHENLTPDKDTTLWRYTTFSTLCEILINNYIPLVSIINFTDKSEGAILRELFHRESDEITADIMMQAYYREIAVSSWHKSKNENAAMWERYGKNGEGVAIKTNAKRLVDSVNRHNLDKEIGDQIHNNNMYHRLVVKEIEYTAQKPSDFTIPYNMLRRGYDIISFFYKMIDFKDEEEVRVLFIDHWGLPNILNSVISDNLMNIRDRESSSFYQDIKNRGDQGYAMNIQSPNDIIEEIIISPYAHKKMINTVKKVVEKTCKKPITFGIHESNRSKWI